MLGIKIFEKLGLQSAAPAVSSEPVDQTTCAHYESGLALAEQGLHAEAIKEFRKSIGKSWNAFEPHYELGKSYQELGEPEKANQEFRTALRFCPNHVEAHKHLGMSYDAAGNSVEAIKIFMQALRIKSNAVDIRNHLAMAYFNVGSYAEAMKAYDQVLEREPDHAAAHYGRALVHIDLRNEDLALIEHKKLLNLGQTEFAARVLEEIQQQFGK
jgi:protein O-GlcNAc transferase